jgi:cysteinyl-tRNA synthetase, unknown class
MALLDATMANSSVSGFDKARAALGRIGSSVSSRAPGLVSGLSLLPLLLTVPIAYLLSFWNLKDTSRAAWIARAAMVLVVGWFAWSWRDVPGDWMAYERGERPLAKVTSWHYQLTQPNLDVLAKVPADMLVIDYAKNSGKDPLTRDELQRLRTQPNGKDRVLISYLSVGESEEFRYYWDQAWKTAKPDWLVRENCAWPKAWMVRFWDEGWKSIVYKGADAYLKRIIAAGFDGVYLDRIDMYEHTQALNPKARDAMIDFVAELAETARALKPGFIVIAQNAEDLLSERRYRRVIDGIAKEELLFSQTGTGERNKTKDIAWSIERLEKLRWEWKPVFPVEYLLTSEAIAAAKQEVRDLGFVGVFPNRSLNGGDPTAPQTLKTEAGTPEYIKDKCAPGSAW